MDREEIVLDLLAVTPATPNGAKPKNVLMTMPEIAIWHMPFSRQKRAALEELGEVEWIIFAGLSCREKEDSGSLIQPRQLFVKLAGEEPRLLVQDTLLPPSPNALSHWVGIEGVVFGEDDMSLRYAWHDPRKTAQFKNKRARFHKLDELPNDTPLDMIDLMLEIESWQSSERASTLARVSGSLLYG
jgi:hypothetical protein